jgi:hypothetical protein
MSLTPLGDSSDDVLALLLSFSLDDARERMVSRVIRSVGAVVDACPCVRIVDAHWCASVGLVVVNACIALSVCRLNASKMRARSCEGAFSSLSAIGLYYCTTRVFYRLFFFDLSIPPPRSTFNIFP